MDFEEYLIEEKYCIVAISQISLLIETKLKDNLFQILKGKIDKKFLDEILSLNKIFQMIAFCMRLKRRNKYTELDKNYEDNFTIDSIMY